MKKLIVVSIALILLANQSALANDSTSITPNTTLTNADQRKSYVLEKGTVQLRCNWSSANSTLVQNVSNCYGYRVTTTFCIKNYFPVAKLAFFGYFPSSTSGTDATFASILIGSPRIDKNPDGYYFVFADPANGLAQNAKAHWDSSSDDADVVISYIIFCWPS